MGSPAHAFILAGGRGTRFWPLSRKAHPKQLLDLTGDGSLLSLTLDRISGVVPPERQWVLTSETLREAVMGAAPRVPKEQIIGEPVGRNTAPAIALAAALLEQTSRRTPFAVLPSDHLISPADHYRESLRNALDYVDQHEELLTFGVVPTRPETGYGYIECAQDVTQQRTPQPVVSFREKPDPQQAQEFLAEGRYLWNSGMFAWRSDVLLDCLGAHEPEMVSVAREIAQAGTEGLPAALEKIYPRIPANSIDYALLEKATNVVVLPAGFDWNDVGHWLSMRDLWPKDASGNALRGPVVAIDSADNIVYGDERLSALVGVSGLIVVQTADATLVCSADRAQDVRKVLDELQDRGDDRFL